ncbi:DUF6518 family protein [Micromonospora sp. BRA006-A]|nr:DUF6518 family protein [Micromonospora sp. BRA006-A]
MAVFVEEALRFALKSGSYPGAWWNVAIDLALAALLVVLIGRSARVRLLAAAVALPMAALGAVTFATVAG